MKYRIIEDSAGQFRVQFRVCFIWFTLQRHSWAGSWIAVFETKQSALREVERQKKLDKYKTKAKVHQVEEK